MEWISVEDRLPDYSQRVIIWFPLESMTASGYRDLFYSREGCGFEGTSDWCTDEYCPAASAYGEPTHWMPLPTPPNG